MNKIYVVGKVGYEYDDNYYYRGQGGGSIPEHAFTSLEKAENYCNQKNLEFYKTTPIRDYMDARLDEFFDTTGSDLMAKFLGEDWYDKFEEDYHNPWPLTDEQWLQLVPHLTVILYEINEVELNE